MIFLLHIALILALVGLNAFFVGAEYALLSLRRSRLQQLVRQGNSRAVLAQRLLAQPSLLFSGLQLGITIASLLLGWLGERLLAGYVGEVLSGVLESSLGAVSHTVAAVTAFVLITGSLMVFGELAPKTIGYERAEIVSLICAWPLTVYMRIAYYPVAFMDWMANRVAALVGVAPSVGYSEKHTPEEVKLIVAGIRKRGLLGEEQEEMIHSVIDLHRMRVREIMVPWNKTTCLALSQDLTAILERVVDDEHSRIPIYDASPDRIVGILHTKDLLRVMRERREQGLPVDAPLDLRSILHAPMIVPETMTLNRLLEESRRRHSQMALVVDEFGTFVGVVTIEDVLEQIVGEIQDEYDEEETAIRRVSENVLVVDGALNLRDLADDYEIVLPRGAGYETLAGFVLARLENIPGGGESFVFENRRFTVLEMDGRRVARVRVEKLPGVAASAVKPPAA
jgi:putative hemolysin